MSKTNIEWTNATINPTMGCTLKSDGCSNCYAMKMAHRLQAIGVKDYEGTTKKLKSGRIVWTGKINFNIDKMNVALKTKKPTMYFVDSMSDLFHDKVPIDVIFEAFNIMQMADHHVFQILTKRPERMLKILSDNLLAPNIWLGVSVENQQTADERIPLLLQTPAAIRWLSIEPMLERIKLEELKYDWVIIGCESGYSRRECKIEWIEDIINQCKSANVPVFVKQLQIDGKVVKDISLFPKHLQIREYPKVES